MPALVYAAGGSDNARWRGGKFIGEVNAGNYPAGNVFQLSGTDLILEGISVEGYRNGVAFSLSGARVQLIDPMIANPSHQDIGGVRVTGGTGFRMQGGEVQVGGDAILVSPHAAVEADLMDIEDCAVRGTMVTSATGSLLAVETANKAITNARFEGIRGTGGGSGNAIRIVNLPRASGAATITDLVYRDIVVTCGASTAETIFVKNLLDGLVRPIANLDFDNVRIIDPKGISFWVSSGDKDVEDVRWSGGGVSGSNYSGACIRLRRLTGGLFSTLTLTAGSMGPVVDIGDTFQCANIAFADVTIGGVTANNVGIAFNKATSCGWSRGAMTGAATAIAASFTSAAMGCFVEEANLAAIGTDSATANKIALSGTTTRLSANYGSVQRTPIGFGPAVSVALTGSGTGTAIATVSSSAIVTGTGAASLYTINGGAEGGLLTLTNGRTGTLTVKDGTALKLAGDCLLASANDTLTLLRRETDWIEIARSING